MEETTTQPKVYIHLIRHAQAESNYNAIRITAEQQTNPPTLLPKITQEEIAHYRSIRDPSLTAHGIQQAKTLAQNFPYMDSLTHIITSPLRRTLQTTLLGLAPAIFKKEGERLGRGRGIKPIALDILRETGSHPNSCGTADLAGLLEELGRDLDVDVDVDVNDGNGREKVIITRELAPGWEEMPPSSSAAKPTMKVGLRANIVKFRIKDLARVARMTLSERKKARRELESDGTETARALDGHENRWLVEYTTDDDNDNEDDDDGAIPCVVNDNHHPEKDIHIAVVSHGTFLKRVIDEKNGIQLGNAEYRTFTFQEGEGMDGYRLVETRESRERWAERLWEKEAERRERRERRRLVALAEAAVEVESVRTRLREVAGLALVRMEEIEEEEMEQEEMEKEKCTRVKIRLVSKKEEGRCKRLKIRLVLKRKQDAISC